MTLRRSVLALLLACAMLTRHVGVVWPIAMLLTAAAGRLVGRK